MFATDGQNIRLTRGDTAFFAVDIVREMSDGSTEAYELAEGDRITFSAKRPGAPGVILQITQTGDSVIRLRPEDTKHLPPGRYMYDVQLDTAAGEVYTVIGPDGTHAVPEFEILPEVTE